MTEINESEIPISNESQKEKETQATSELILNPEFNITVRQLELPVRPRGVLAE